MRLLNHTRMASENSYCRLCSELKPTSKLTLIDGTQKCRELNLKLSRLNSELDFDNILPKTVCLVCLDYLQQAINFINTIEQAQETLNKVFSEKLEIEVKGTEEHFENYSYCSSLDVKEDIFGKISECELSVDIKDRKNPLSIDNSESPLCLNENYTECPQHVDNERDSPLRVDDEDKASLQCVDDINKQCTLLTDGACSASPIKTKNVSVKSTTSRKNSNETYRSNSVDELPPSQLKQTWKDYPWVCMICDTSFDKYEQLKSHGMQYHKQCNVTRCADCKSKKYRLREFLIHVRRHRQHLKLFCYICHTEFKSVLDGPKHYREHVQTAHKCDGCQTCFGSSDDLNQHTQMFYNDKTYSMKDKKKVREKGYKPLTCPVCSKVCESVGGYYRHKQTHSRTRSHVCDLCGKGFFNKPTLDDHMLVHSGVRAYPCEICKKTFTRLCHLRKHISIHDAVKPFSCEQCGSSFRLQKQLKSHSLIHTDNRPHECHICSKRFRFKTTLNGHLRQHTGIKPYSCDKCQRDFTCWGNWNKHMKSIHNTDMAKKKQNEDGSNQIGLVTEHVSKDLNEWKKSVLTPMKPGRKAESALKSKDNRNNE